MSRAISGQLDSIARKVTDLIAALCIVLVATLVVVLDGPATLRVPVTLVSVLFLPGYVCTVALFPASEDRAAVETTANSGITRLERVVLSIGLSVALVALSGLALDALVSRLTTTTFIVTLVTVTVGLVAAAAVRRRSLPSAARYEPTLAGCSIAGDGSSLRDVDTFTLVLLAVLFTGGAITAQGSLGQQSDGVTELYLLTDDGERNASDYPTQFTQGHGESLSVAVGNREGETVAYTVVGQLQRAERRGNRTVIRERSRIATERVRVRDTETSVLNETVTVEEPGRYRLVYLLYRGDPPETARIRTAYREVHLWITVGEADR